MSAPEWFPVTDPYLDAPDGAVVFFEDHGAAYERVGMEWCRREINAIRTQNIGPVHVGRRYDDVWHCDPDCSHPDHDV